MNCIHFDEIDSTNKYLKENFDSLENFTFVSSDYQSGGKGRENRVWLSNNSENLLFSFLIKDQSLLKKFNVLSIGTATLVARFLELKGLKNVSVKWPNDVYVNDKKICGILLEGNVDQFLAIGVGLNVNQTKFDGDYRVDPTSMKIELKEDIDLEALEVELFEFIFKHINQKLFNKKTFEFLNTHNYLLNKKVKAGNIIGKVSGITKDFGLLIGDTAINSLEIKII
ncbi:MAG: biotin--[acetyl-CoA-carboxylase] ligase [Firmicutes bacterium]|nr:biotin--[acetyl-CoA-carboxylase] ligase [Candidatus Fiminaster equi]